MNDLPGQPLEKRADDKPRGLGNLHRCVTLKSCVSN